MTRGRKPKPTRLRALEGNPGRRPFNPDEPKPAAVEPEKPGDLSPLEGEIWDAVAEDLRAMKLFHRADTSLLVGFVHSYARALECDAAARREGLVIDTPHGRKRNPHTTLSREAWIAVKAFGSELGLSPSARSRLQVTPGGQGGGLMELVRQAQEMRGR